MQEPCKEAQLRRDQNSIAGDDAGGSASRDRGVWCSMQLTFSVFGLLFGLALLHYISTLCMVGGCVGQA